jgi:hypothetical protein
MRTRPRTAFLAILVCLLLVGATACKRAQGEPLPAAPPPPTEPEPPKSKRERRPAGEAITIAAVGDIMMGSTYPAGSPLPPNDGADVFPEVTPILSAADIAFGNLEGPMLEGGTTEKCGPTSRSCFAFRVPTRYGRHLKNAGFDLLSVANNHASDFGAYGRESTQRVLSELGIKHAGGDENDVARMTVNGRRIAVIGFATNRISLNLNDIEIAKRAVAKEKKNADLVFVSFHGGAEGEAAQHVPQGNEIFLGESRGNLRAFTHAVIDAGADLVIGHGPHVVRGLEIYKDRFITYSLGNFCTYGFRLAGATALSMILEVRLNPDGSFAGGKVHAAKQVGRGGPALDPSGAVLGVLRNLSTTDFGANAVKIAADGTLSAP